MTVQNLSDSPSKEYEGSNCDLADKISVGRQDTAVNSAAPASLSASGSFIQPPRRSYSQTNAINDADRLFDDLDDAALDDAWPSPLAESKCVQSASSAAVQISQDIFPALSSGNHPIINSSVSDTINKSSDTSLVMRFGSLENAELSQNYDVGNTVGRGASAVVHEAWRKQDHLHVVIKVLQGIVDEDEEQMKISTRRFYREAELISSLDEQHIVRCVDYGRFEGTPCMVLDYVDGLSLDKFLEKYGALSLAYATGIIEQLLCALAETHSKGIIHRDIKPGNIMVFDMAPPYEIRVLDFGISSVLEGFQSKTLMTQAGSVRGTPSYMAPELFTGESHASVESDLYAVGLVYLECLTGKVAVNDKSFMRVAYKQVNEPLEVPGFIPPCITDIILKLCTKTVNARYHSAQDVLDDIRSCIDKALKDEDSCIKEWEKTHSVRRGKIALTDDGAVQNRRRHLMIAVAAAFVCIAVSVAAMLLFALNSAREQEPSVVVVESPDSQEAIKRARADVAQARLRTAMLEANIAVFRAWNAASAPLILEKKEADSLALKPAPTNDHVQIKKISNSGNKKTEKKKPSGVIPSAVKNSVK